MTTHSHALEHILRYSIPVHADTDDSHFSSSFFCIRSGVERKPASACHAQSEPNAQTETVAKAASEAVAAGEKDPHKPVPAAERDNEGCVRGNEISACSPLFFFSLGSTFPFVSSLNSPPPPLADYENALSACF